jgi:tetratricopeptide (TPR) repeat protein
LPAGKARAKSQPLSHADKQHLRAAEGWFELGNLKEANAELDEIAPATRTHPDVLAMRVRIYEMAGQWQGAVEIASTLCKLRPKEGLPCLYLGRALDGLGNTAAAIDFLRHAADNFPNDSTLSYDLAVYCCKAGQLEAGREWLKRAIEVSGSGELKLRALYEPKRIQEIEDIEDRLRKLVEEFEDDFTEPTALAPIVQKDLKAALQSLDLLKNHYKSKDKKRK